MDVGGEPLVLKVMRLRRPCLQAPAPMVPLPEGAAEVVEAPKLLVPMSLTQSLVGEPFDGYLHLANQSASRVTNVVLRVELQIGDAKHVLFNNLADPVSFIAPGEFFDANVNHELRSAGTYVLTCKATYGHPGIAEQGVLRRSYRFPSLQPFAVTHRLVQLDTQLLVECGIDNATQGAIYLTSWRFDCAEGFEATQLDGEQPPLLSKSDNGDCPADGTMCLLKPRGAHSLVFRVVPKSGAIDIAAVRDLERIGSLALGWHLPDGPSGCAEGHVITVKPFPARALDLRVVACPRKVQVETPFQLEIEVANRMGRAVLPSILFDVRLMGGIRVNGTTQHTLGRLEPNSTMRVPVPLLVAVPGMHGLQGISLVDELSKTRSEFGVLCDVLAF